MLTPHSPNARVHPSHGIGQHLIVLKGSLAPESAVVKLSGKGLPLFKGPAIVFDSEQQAFQGVMTGKVRRRWGDGEPHPRAVQKRRLRV
jgi:dihydroxyacid dehydratase/phosphogluconate dehydratase